MDVALVPAGVVTVMSTVPAAPAGEVAVIEVGELSVTAVAEWVPNFTVESEVKPFPVIVTAVPPAVEPADGLTLATEGPPYVK
jgi:hypothetical protein